MYESRNVLVTGGTGMIGSHLVELLLERGANVRTVVHSRRPRARYLGDVDFFVEEKGWDGPARELIADPGKAERKLGWEPKIKFKDLVKTMVDADIRKVGLKPHEEGDEILKKKFLNRWWKTE